MYRFNYGDPRKKSLKIYESTKSVRKISAPARIEKNPQEEELTANWTSNCIQMNETTEADTGKINKLFWTNGKLKYIGFVDKEKKRNGRGQYYDVHGNLYFCGTFKDNRFEGQYCEYYHTNKMYRYKGGAINGLMGGNGIEFYKNGKMKFRGNFERGRPNFNNFNVEYHANGQISKIGKNQETEVEKPPNSGKFKTVSEFIGTDFVSQGVDVRYYVAPPEVEQEVDVNGVNVNQGNNQAVNAQPQDQNNNNAGQAPVNRDIALNRADFQHVLVAIRQWRANGGINNQQGENPIALPDGRQLRDADLQQIVEMINQARNQPQNQQNPPNPPQN